MPKKTITIFITTFIIVGIIIVTVYSWLNKDDSVTTEDTTPWYQDFNPFGTGDNIIDNVTPEEEDIGNQTQEEITQLSKFYQITDFAVAGATFLEDIRPIIKKDGEIQPEPIKEIIKTDTKEGKKDIQIILNEKLSLTPPLIVDGNFGKKTIEAIKNFQKLNNLSTTGTIDEFTSPYFTKTITQEENPFEQAPSVRFVEKKNGHIYKMFLDTKVKEKVSNSTIPEIYEVFFNKIGGTVIYRYLSSDKIINSFIATLGATKGEFLPQNISDLSISKDGTKFFYLTENTNGSSGSIGLFGETKKSPVFNSPFTEWLSQWDNNGRIFLTTKAIYDVPGSIFLLNTSNKTISKIFGGVMGLTTLVSPNGSLLLYSTSTETGPKLGVLDIDKYSTKDLDTYGLPEKCVWGNDSVNIYCAVPNTINGNQYPDLWYQGLVSFNDYFVKINTITKNKITVANSTDETNIDGTNLFLNTKNDVLFFINKKDSTLWSLDIK